MRQVPIVFRCNEQKVHEKTMAAARLRRQRKCPNLAHTAESIHLHHVEETQDKNPPFIAADGLGEPKTLEVEAMHPGDDRDQKEDAMGPLRL